MRFVDGKEGEVDLSAPVGKGVFARWADPEGFEKVYIDEESGTTAWPGGIDWRRMRFTVTWPDRRPRRARARARVYPAPSPRS